MELGIDYSILHGNYEMKCTICLQKYFNVYSQTMFIVLIFLGYRKPIYCILQKKG